MDSLTNRLSLLEHQALALLCLVRLGACRGKLVQRLAVHSGLLGQLPAEEPARKMPGRTEAGEHKQ